MAQKASQTAPALPVAASVDVERAAAHLEGARPEDVLAWALDVFHPRVALASSFGLEDVVLMDMLRRLRRDARVFAIDTGRLPDATHAVADAHRRRGAVIEWSFPQRIAVETLEREKGLYSFRESLAARHECCEIRKVEPLRRALSGLDAWVTGLRRAQNVTREALRVVERDAANGGITKVNPLAAWSEDDVWRYVRDHEVPYNALHDRGYPSIGCAPCTRAVGPGEHARAGRWWWESSEHKECGLHRRPDGASAGAGTHAGAGEQE